MKACKDIPTLPLLEHLAGRIHRPGDRDVMTRARWTTHWSITKTDDPGWPLPFPENTPEKLRLAKMSQLLSKGLVDGCDCGCRGDWTITDKGLARIEEMKKALGH